jgi:hypothetical protein
MRLLKAPPHTMLHSESGPTSDRQFAILVRGLSRAISNGLYLMDDSFRQQVATFEHRLSHLLRDGFDLQRALSAEPGAPDLEVMRAWQRECAATISQLSGGSKQHWLSRAYSEAFLLKAPDSSGAAQVTAGEAEAGTIVERIIVVLRQAQASLAEMRQSGIPNTEAPPARRFGFVHDPNLRPRLEQAFVDAQAAFDRGAYDLAVVTWASVLEAMLTDALEHHIAAHGGASGVDRVVTDWTFDARIGAAEQARLISLGCARLPAVARRYRELLDADGELRGEVPATERDAKVTGQVLRLIMRDLAPGR